MAAIAKQATGCKQRCFDVELLPWEFLYGRCTRICMRVLLDSPKSYNKLTWRFSWKNKLTCSVEISQNSGLYKTALIHGDYRGILAAS